MIGRNFVIAAASIIGLAILVAILGIPSLWENESERLPSLSEGAPEVELPPITGDFDLSCNSSETLALASQLYSAASNPSLLNAEDSLDPLTANVENAPKSSVGFGSGPPDTAQCRPNLEAEVDECGVKARGNACQGRSTPNDLSDDTCCDWSLKKDGSRDTCDCNTAVLGQENCRKPAICEVCMLIAEASTETHDWCKLMVLCTMRERQKWNNDPNICTTLARKTGDGTWFTPDKCTCDRTSPNRRKNPNSQYCDCRDARCAGQSYPRFDEFSQFLNQQCPKVSPNFYNNGCGNPCDRGGNVITPPPGVTCKHTFYRCTVP